MSANALTFNGKGSGDFLLQQIIWQGTPLLALRPSCFNNGKNIFFDKQCPVLIKSKKICEIEIQFKLCIQFKTECVAANLIVIDISKNCPIYDVELKPLKPCQKDDVEFSFLYKVDECSALAFAFTGISAECICKMYFNGTIIDISHADDLELLKQADLRNAQYIIAKPTDEFAPPKPQTPQEDSVYIPAWANTIPYGPLTFTGNPPVNPTSLGVPNANFYNRFQAINYLWGYAMGLNLLKISSSDPRLPLYITNLINRGLFPTPTPNNQLTANFNSPANINVNTKAAIVKYASLSGIITNNYKDKIGATFNKFYNLIVFQKKPVLSSFYNCMFELWASLHFGDDCKCGHPHFLRQYYDTFLLIVGYTGVDRGEDADVDLDYCYETSCKVRAYVNSRLNKIVCKNDKTTFPYHWKDGGANVGNIEAETLYNIFIFGKLVRMMYYLMMNSLGKLYYVDNCGKPGFRKLPFVEDFNAAIDEPTRLNVVREMFRLIPFHPYTLSQLGNSSTQTYHIHQQMMIDSDSTQNLPDEYWVYKPNNNFSSVLASPARFDLTIPSPPVELVPKARSFFKISTNPDNQTLVEISDSAARLTPVFNKAHYASFGLGYNREPLEVFILFMGSQMLSILNGLSFKCVDTNNTPIPVAPYTILEDKFYVDQ